IHTGIFYLIAFLATTIFLSDKKNSIRCDQLLNKESNKLFFIALIIFTFGWKLWHFATEGNFVTFSFPIRALLFGWITSFDV
ncbi:MAG: hypothetical protein K6C33_07795, partial [Desulfovibrio sp.]|nr:hypothetical protein [Desulfovibrio sp.]